MYRKWFSLFIKRLLTTQNINYNIILLAVYRNMHGKPYPCSNHLHVCTWQLGACMHVGCVHPVF